eukprot:s121_g22.t1
MLAQTRTRSAEGLRALHLAAGPVAPVLVLLGSNASNRGGCGEVVKVLLKARADGTNEYCRLDQLPEDGDEDVEVGPEIRKINQKITHVAGASIAFCASHGYDNCTKSGEYLVRGGDYSDEVAELTEESCSAWISLLNRARLMLVYFFGEGRGQLELLPFDEDSDAVELSTEPDMLVILRADQMHHKHQSNRGTFSILSWITAAENSTTRGWTGGLSRTFGATIPTARELVDWAQERLKDLLEMETLDKDAEIPREWQLMMRHSFFRHNRSPVAVRGEAGHLPTTNNTRVLWDAINQGSDFVTDIPYHRWDHELYYDSDPNCWMQAQSWSRGLIKTNVKHGQFIEGVDLFDNKFFGVSNMEATGMDPMQRHILETSYEGLFMAGYTKKTLMGKYIAVFTGCTNPEWNYIDKEAGACSGTGSSQAITSNRTSFLLGIMGPSTSIDCDQSSAGMALMVGATAVTPATERRTESGGDSEAAICGGVFLQMTPFMWPRFQAYMNPNGRCFSFDQCANGYIRGECCASAALKPYAEKTKSGDLSVIEGPCIGTLVGWRMTNNGRSAGLHAPSGPAEQEAIADAIRHAGISPLDLDAMECHSAGHLLSDGVEVVSATTVCRGMEGGDREVLILGSIKTNVGIQQEACGMSSFLKVLYNISYANNAPTIHLKQLNPHIELGDSAVCFNTEALAYKDSRAFHGCGTRGLGGTNINMICWYSADGSRALSLGYSQESYANWSSYVGGQWPAQPSKGSKTQTRRRSRRAHKQNSGTQAKQAQEPMLAPPMPPPLVGQSGQVEAPWMNFAAPGTAGDAAASSSSSAEKALKELATAIKQNPETMNTLSPRAQALVKNSLVQAGRAETKGMHSAVEQMGKAKEQLQEAVLARSQMLASWHAFLNHSIELGKQYMTLFQQQETSLTDRIREAQENLVLVQESFDNRKDAMKEDVIHIDDDTAKDQEMATASALASTKIRAGLEGMQSSLTQLASEAVIEVQQHNKRQRTADGPDVPSGLPPKSGAMEPFGAGGVA